MTWEKNFFLFSFTRSQCDRHRSMIGGNLFLSCYYFPNLTGGGRMTWEHDNWFSGRLLPGTASYLKVSSSRSSIDEDQLQRTAAVALPVNGTWEEENIIIQLISYKILWTDKKLICHFIQVLFVKKKRISFVGGNFNRLHGTILIRKLVESIKMIRTCLFNMFI